MAERRRLGDLRPGKCFGRPLKARMLDCDVRFFQAVLNWGVRAGLLDRNPIKGFRVELSESPQRPILTADQYEALLAVAEGVDAAFRLALIIVNETGHRIGAVRLLKWSDVDLQVSTVRWRGENDKIKHDHVTPLTPAALEALRAARFASLAIGEGWILPAPADPSKPVSRFLVRDWWQRGEQLAGLEPAERRGWHSLRRKFATEMKHTPTKDLCALGGWKAPQTVLTCYQRPDPVTMRAALAQRIRLQA